MTLRVANGETLDVTLVNKDTKKAQNMISRYFRAQHDDIKKAYKKPSHEKVRTFEVIKNEFKRVNGRNLKVTSAGMHVYSCAYVVRDGSILEDGQGFVYLIYHTVGNRFAIKI